jgi:hypothetical protein
MTSPPEIFERLVRGIAEERWGELPDLYAEDAVVDQPFAPNTPRIQGARDAPQTLRRGGGTGTPAGAQHRRPQHRRPRGDHRGVRLRRARAQHWPIVSR